jgi:hypothetical protein
MSALGNELPPRLSQRIKWKLEAETFVHFRNALRRRGHAGFDFLEHRDRPDCLIRETATDEPLGVEVTRIVRSDDAAHLMREFFMTATVGEVLARHARGGRGILLGGKFPETHPSALKRLAKSLDAAICAAGSIERLVRRSRTGEWEHEGSVYEFELQDREGWHFLSNGVIAPRRSRLPEAELDDLLLKRLRRKRNQMRTFEWDRRLVLLVRSPYQPYVPSLETLAEAGQLCADSVDEAWLVNHAESALDLSPPEPVLVQLWPDQGARVPPE